MNAPMTITTATQTAEAIYLPTISTIDQAAKVLSLPHISTADRTGELFGVYTVERTIKQIEGKDWFLAKVTKPSPRGRFKTKKVFHYRFHSDEAREAYVSAWKQDIAHRDQERSQRKQAKAQAKRNMVNPFQVGDILYGSYGYDQTNYHFYQVVKSESKSIVVRELVKNIEKYAADNMAYYVKPVKDSFEGEPIKKRLVCDLGGNVYCKFTHFNLHPWKGDAKYETHYA